MVSSRQSETADSQFPPLFNWPVRVTGTFSASLIAFFVAKPRYIRVKPVAIKIVKRGAI